MRSQPYPIFSWERYRTIFAFQNRCHEIVIYDFVCTMRAPKIAIRYIILPVSIFTRKYIVRTP